MSMGLGTVCVLLASFFVALVKGTRIAGTGLIVVLVPAQPPMSCAEPRSRLFLRRWLKRCCPCRTVRCLRSLFSMCFVLAVVMVFFPGMLACNLCLPCFRSTSYVRSHARDHSRTTFGVQTYVDGRERVSSFTVGDESRVSKAGLGIRLEPDRAFSRATSGVRLHVSFSVALVWDTCPKGMAFTWD